MMQFLKIGTLRAMALLVIILGLTTACSTKPEKIETLGSKLRQECFQYAEKISKKLPILVDDKALWTATTCQYGTTIKPVLTYIYEIKNAQKFTQLEINTMAPIIKKRICFHLEDKDRLLIEDKEFRFIDRSNRDYIGKILITAQDCAAYS